MLVDILECNVVYGKGDCRADLDIALFAQPGMQLAIGMTIMIVGIFHRERFRTWLGISPNLSR